LTVVAVAVLTTSIW